MHNIVHYLTDGFWQDFGESRRKFNVQPGGTLTANIAALEPQSQLLAEIALDLWSNVTGINFRFVGHRSAHIIFSDDGEDAFAFHIGERDGIIDRAYVNVPYDWLYEEWLYTDNLNESFLTYIHEIGHALGLGHPGPYNDDFAVFQQARFPSLDSYQVTVMSYFDQDDNPLVFGDIAYPATPMIADIQAIHALYGAPESVNGGDTTYGYGANTGTLLDSLFQDWLMGQQNNPYPPDKVALTIYDTGGDDWLDFRTDIYNQVIDLSPVSVSSIYGLTNNLTIAHDTIIEHVVAGSGNDFILGNEANNALYGSGGHDVLSGWTGDDWLIGGSGDDVLIGGRGNDQLTGGSGYDEFVFSPEDGFDFDTIVDFSKEHDLINLSEFNTIHSVHDFGYYWLDETRTDFLIDLTEHGGGLIILEGYTGIIDDFDVVFWHDVAIA